MWSTTRALLFALLTVAAVACRERQSTRGSIDAEAPPERVMATSAGLASTYAARLAGRRTASGAPYDPARMTAAHRSLPLGTRVRVSRIDRRGIATGAAVIVTINDRGPYEPGRIIDLSEAAAKHLGLWNTVGRVRIEVLASSSR